MNDALVAVVVFFIVLSLGLFGMLFIAHAANKVKIAKLELELFQIELRIPSDEAFRYKVLGTGLYFKSDDPFTPSHRYYYGTLGEMLNVLIKQAGIKYIPPTQGRLTIIKDE